MRKITWIKIAHSKKYGGQAYGDKVKDIARGQSDFYEWEIRSSHAIPRYIKPFSWYLQFRKLRGKSDIWIFDSFISVAFTNFAKLEGKKIILIYHIDNSVFPIMARPFFYFLETLFYRNAKKADAIITISDYWKKHFLAKGYKNVRRIYNSFETQEYSFPAEEIEDFKKSNGLSRRPIVYIGNCQKAKGVVESYEALRNLDVDLVTSGEKTVDIPARNFIVTHQEYAKLLKAATVVVTMSKFKEGWCGTAHEAMLCRTPVVGSGLGGMKELLEGGKQMVCPDFKDVSEKVNYLLLNRRAREHMGDNGFAYAKEFTKERFQREWSDIIRHL